MLDSYKIIFVQVHVEVQAFLTLPDLTAEGGELDDHCQVIQPFSIETAVDHCVEPTATGNYRCFHTTLTCSASTFFSVSDSPMLMFKSIACAGCCSSSLLCYLQQQAVFALQRRHTCAFSPMASAALF